MVRVKLLRRRLLGGLLGTAIAKVFDLNVGMTGATEKFCRTEGVPYRSVVVHPNNHAGYYPGATILTLKLVFSPETHKVLGAQIIGYGGVDKRIDVLATAIMGGMTVDDLAGFAAQNILDGLVKVTTWDAVQSADPSEHLLIDVRTPEEFANGNIAGAINIPLDNLRERIGEIPAEKKVTVLCRVGLRSYIACRILMSKGVYTCSNLSGGY